MRLDDRTLRAIGQDLEAIGLFDFDLDLELEGERCVVRGVVDAPASSGTSLPSRGLKEWWKQYGNAESYVPSELAPVPIERVYLPRDIDRLDIEGKSRCRDKPAQPKRRDRPEGHSVAEILRVLAAYCKTAGFQPVSVSKRGERLTYDYLTESGHRQVEARVFSDLYRFMDGMVLKRKERGSEKKRLLRRPRNLSSEQAVTPLTTPTDDQGL